MNKQKIIILSIVLALGIVGIIAANYLLSFHKVSFVVKQPNLTISIYKVGGGKAIANFTDETYNLSLIDGSYKYLASGTDDISSTETIFTVAGKPSEVIIDPDYSESYLSELLKTEKSNILTTIKSKYAFLASGYTILDVTLFKKGEWCGAIIQKNTNSQDIPDEYRVILKKDNVTWSVIDTPQIVATKYNFPDVPLEILTLANNLSGY